MAHRISTQKLAKLLGIGEKNQFGDIVLDYAIKPEEVEKHPDNYSSSTKILSETTLNVLKTGYNYYTAYDNQKNLVSWPSITVNLGYPEQGMEEKNLIDEKDLALVLAACHAKVPYIFAEFTGSEKLAQMLFDIHLPVSSSMTQKNKSDETQEKMDWTALNRTIKPLSTNDWDDPQWVINQLMANKVIDVLENANPNVWNNLDAVQYLLMSLQSKNYQGMHYKTRLQEYLGEEKTTEILMCPEVVAHILKTPVLFDPNILAFYCEKAHVSARYEKNNSIVKKRMEEYPQYSDSNVVQAVQKEFDKAWHDEQLMSNHLKNSILLFNVAPVDVRMNKNNLEKAYEYVNQKRSFVHFFDDFPESFFQNRDSMRNLLVSMIQQASREDRNLLITHWKNNKEDVLYYVDYVQRQLDTNARDIYKIFWELGEEVRNDIDVVCVFVKKNDTIYDSYKPVLPQAIKDHPKVMIAHLYNASTDEKSFDWDKVFKLDESIAEEKEYIKTFITIYPELLCDNDCPASWKENVEYILLSDQKLGMLNFSDAVWKEITNTPEKCLDIVKNKDWQLFSYLPEEMRVNKDILEVVITKISEMPNKKTANLLGIKAGAGIYEKIPDYLWQDNEFCAWALSLNPEKTLLDFIPQEKLSQPQFMLEIFDRLDKRLLPLTLVEHFPKEIKNFVDMIEEPIGKLRDLLSRSLIKARLDNHFEHSDNEITEEDFSPVKMKI
jgi:hypothetical protein